MSIIDEMWDIHVRSCKHIEGKLYVNLTGGLDSRVLAGVLTYLGHRISCGHYAYDRGNVQNIKHIAELAKLLNYENFFFLTRVESGFDQIDRKLNLAQYTWVIHSYGNFSTGMYQSKQFLREKWYDRQTKINEHERYFKNVYKPFDNVYYVGYMDNLPFIWNFQQRAYRAMIKKYLPHLYDISRCFENYQSPVDLDYYIPRRVVNKLLRR